MVVASSKLIRIIAASISTALVLVLLASGNASGAPGTADVRVVNTAANPVPVSGTVNAAQSGAWNVGVSGPVSASQSGPWNVGINGTPSVAAQQSGSWSVGITGRPSVQSSPLEPVSFGISGFSGILSGSANAGGSVFTVPAGKRLIIEYVSFSVSLPAGQRVRAQVGGPPTGHYVVMESTGTFNNNDTFAAGEPVRHYVGPGSNVFCSVIRNSTIGSGNYACWLDGYLVDA